MRSNQVFFSTFAFLTVIVVISFMAILVCNLEVSWSSLQFYPSALLVKYSSYEQKSETNQFATASCQLLKRNPWEESVLEVFDPLYSYQAQCNITKLRTKLENATLVTIEEKDNCWGSCLKRMSSSKYSNEKWQNGTSIFKCDIVEVRCSRTPNIEDYDYIWVHTQVYENEKVKNTTAKTGENIYNVFLLILDSTSYTQSNRNLPKMLNYLKMSLNGIEFPFLNRVAQNSKPNSVPLFLGEIAEKVDREIIGLPSLKPTVNMGRVDMSKSVQSEYTKNGYVTAFYEDSIYEIIDFGKGLTTHHNTPFRRFWQRPPKKLKEIKMKNSCTTDHHIMFEQATQFLQSYEGLPKFLTLWDTGFGHDSMSSSIEADTIIYDFFIKNRKIVSVDWNFHKKLDNSFVIVMGDHGLRIQLGKTTKLGRYEINNPMLLVVPPKELRNNEELMETLRENSQKLQTHHDTRQTLLDILKYQPAVAYSDQEPLDTSLRGSSYLRKQLGERNCFTLPIPFQYCICSQEYEDMDRSSTFAIKIGEFIASEINRRLEKFGIAKKCNKWKLKKLNVLRRIKNIANLDVYEVEGAYEPDAGFTTMVGDFRNGTMKMGAADRTDMYRDRGRCIDDPFKWPICDCIKKKG